MECVSVSCRLLLCLLGPHMYAFVCVFGVSWTWLFKPFPSYLQEDMTWGLTHTHTHTHTRSTVCVQSSDSRPRCHPLLLWVQSPAEQWDTIRSLQRGSGPFAAGFTDIDGGAHAKSVCVRVCACASVFLLISVSRLSLCLSVCLSVFLLLLSPLSTT